MAGNFHNQGDVATCGFVYFFTLTSQSLFATSLVNELKNGKNPFFDIEIQCECLIWISSPNCKKLAKYCLLEGIIDQTDEENWRRLETMLQILFQNNSVDLNEMALDFNFKGIDRIPNFSHFYETNKTINESVIRDQFIHKKLMNKVKVFCSKTKSKVLICKKQGQVHVNTDSSNQNKNLIPKIKTIKPSDSLEDKSISRRSKYPRNYQNEPIVTKNIKDKLKQIENKDKSTINVIPKITSSFLKFQPNQKYCSFHATNLNHEKNAEVLPNKFEKDTLKLPISKMFLRHHRFVTNDSPPLESVKRYYDKNISLEPGNFVITYEVHDLMSRRFSNQRKLKTKEVNIFYGNCVVKVYNNMQIISQLKTSEIMNREKCFPLKQNLILRSLEQTIDEIREFFLSYQDIVMPYQTIDKVINQKQLRLKVVSQDSHLSDPVDNTVRFTDKSTLQNEINYTKFPTLLSDSYFEETYSFDKEPEIFSKELITKHKDSSRSIGSDNSRFDGDYDKVSIINDNEIFRSVSEKETYSFNFEDLIISTKDSGINVEDQSYLPNDNISSDVITDVTPFVVTPLTGENKIINQIKVPVDKNKNLNI